MNAAGVSKSVTDKKLKEGKLRPQFQMNSFGVVDMKHVKLDNMFVFFFSLPFSKDIFQGLLQLPRVPFLRFFQFGQSENSPQKLSPAET